MGAKFYSNKLDKNNILNIYTLGNCDDFLFSVFKGDYNINNNKLYFWITDFSKGGITTDNLNSIKDDIISKFQTKIISNCILIFLESQECLDKKIILINEFLSNIKKIYRPIIILALDEEKKNESENITLTGVDTNSVKINEYVEIVNYKKANYNEIENKIKFIYNYYNNIGDLLTNMVPMINYFSGNGKDNQNKIIKHKHKATLNILVLGRPGCGKSTLINLILNEKKAREGIGYSITKLYSQYVHNSYAITLTDTPGFETDKDLKNMCLFLDNFNSFFKEGRNKFHLVLYLINTSNERTFTGIELELIDKINNSLELPIFFVCTKSRTEEMSMNFIEEVKINLIQKFGHNTKLIEHIYCCHLLNEKDGIYKRFGIDKLLLGIQDYFEDEMKKIKKIQDNFTNLDIMIKNQNAYNLKLNILSSLENANSFKLYLTKLLKNIIEKYQNLILDIDKIGDNDEDNKKKMKKIIETLKNHLAFELDCEPSEINENNKFFGEIEFEPTIFCEAKTNDDFQIAGKKIKIKNETTKRYLKRAEAIENLIENGLSDIIKDIDSYMKDVIKSYQEALNSFTEINNYINNKL